MPIKLSLTSRPEAWHTIEIPAGNGKTAEVRVKYWLLSEREVRALRRAPIERFRDTTEESRIAEIIEMLSDEEAEERRSLLIQRIVDWDIENADEKGKLPVTEETIRAVTDLAPLFVGLYDGLVDASSAPVKKT
jgi:hypothetical protein